MTAQKFMDQIEGYYVRYSEVQKAVVSVYLRQFNEQALDYLFSATIKGFENRWGKAPDVATFEGLRDAVCERLELNQKPSDCLQIEDKSEYLSKEELADVIAKLARKLGGME